jgi:hypothetical protein
MERGESDVLHFLFAKNEALIGRGIVRLRDIGSWHRGSRCTTEQRKTESDRTQSRHGGGLGRAFLPRSLLDPSHGRILSSCERAWRSKFALGERGAQDLPACHKMKWNLGKRAESKRCRRNTKARIDMPKSRPTLCSAGLSRCSGKNGQLISSTWMRPSCTGSRRRSAP